MRGGAMRVGAYLIGTLVSAISAALLLRHLGPVDTGLYVSALALVAIVGSVSDLGLTAVGLREVSTLPPEQRWPLARDLLGLRITLTFVGVTVMTAIAWRAYSGTIAAGVVLAGVGLLLQATQDNFAIPLAVELRLGWVAALDLTRQLLTTFLIALLVVLGAGIVPFFAVSIPVGFVVVTLTALLVHNIRSLAPTFSWRRWRQLLRPILPYSIAVTASALYFRIATLLVGILSTRTQLGYYGASFRIIEVLTVVPALLVGSAFPIFARAARDDHDRLGYALGRVFEVSVIAGAWVAISIAVGAPLAIAIIGGPEFKAAAPVLAYQGVALGGMFVSLVWAYGLLSLGVYRQIMIINIAALLLNSALVVALVEADGARGAAIGTAIAEIFVTLVQARAAIRRQPKLRPPLRLLPRVALAAAIGLSPLLFEGMPTIVRIVFSTTLFGGALLALRAVPSELKDLIPSWSR
jgi:O-antigen/teichoic acid export membrane protein